MRDYKSLRIAVMTWATLVKTDAYTGSRRNRQLLTSYAIISAKDMKQH